MRLSCLIAFSLVPSFDVSRSHWCLGILDIALKHTPALISYGQPSLHGVPPPTRLPTTSFRPPPSPVTSGVARGERRRPRADHHPYDGRTSKKIVSPSFYSTSGFGPPSHFMVSIDPSALQAGRGAGPGSCQFPSHTSHFPPP